MFRRFVRFDEFHRLTQQAWKRDGKTRDLRLNFLISTDHHYSHLLANALHSKLHYLFFISLCVWQHLSVAELNLRFSFSFISLSCRLFHSLADVCVYFFFLHRVSLCGFRLAFCIRLRFQTNKLQREETKNDIFPSSPFVFIFVWQMLFDVFFCCFVVSVSSMRRLLWISRWFWTFTFNFVCRSHLIIASNDFTLSVCTFRYRSFAFSFRRDEKTNILCAPRSFFNRLTIANFSDTEKANVQHTRIDSMSTKTILVITAKRCD